MSSTEHNDQRDLVALIDCNNFYVSCERVFNPKLNNRPVAVLSINDGCVVARSKEVKELGVPMGAPAFEWKEIFRKNGVIVLSSNYALYGDMSARVMSILSQFSPEIQIYSIDEAFLKIPAAQATQIASQIRKTVLQWTGIPVSVGVSFTKTLSKVANKCAKKDAVHGGYFVMDAPDLIQEQLKKLPVIDVWGIGRQTAKFLFRYGIRTALEYAQCDDEWLKKHLKVGGVRMAWELRGVSCLELEEIPPPKQTIISSRSFGYPVTEWEELAESLAMHATTAAEKLRDQESLASYLEVFLTTYPNRPGEFYARKIPVVLPEPTAYTPTLITFAKLALGKIFRKGLEYKKTGILLAGLVPQDRYQPDLFVGHKPALEKQQAISHVVDKLNRKFGYSIVKYAAEGIKQGWGSKRSNFTPRYTTKWNEILKINI